MFKSLKWVVLGLLGFVLVALLIAWGPDYVDYRASRAAAAAQIHRPSGETLVLPAVDGILAAFETHPLVGMGDTHGSAQQMELYAAIVRDPRFARDVGNVVVEFGAAGSQDVIDRYVAGETVTYQELRAVWTDTIGWGPTAGLLGFAKFFSQVRATNQALPPDSRIRVWLGEPPLDWSKVESRGNLRYTWARNQRDSHPARVILRNILARDERALVIYGSLHYHEWSSFFRGSLRGRVEAKHPGTFFVVLPYGTTALQSTACADLLEQASAMWPMPVLAAPSPGSAADSELRNCAILDEADLVARGLLTLAGVEPTRVVGDAVLFLGAADFARDSPMLPDIFLDADYRREVNRRFEIQSGQQLFAMPPDFLLERGAYDADLDAPGYVELLEAMFTEHDLNRDGIVTGAEYADPLRP